MKGIPQSSKVLQQLAILASIASSEFAESWVALQTETEFKATTDSRHSLPLVPNCLNRRFDVEAPNRVWVTDIAYIATDEGWLYLAGVKDLFSGELLGYAMSKRMTTPLVMQGLFRAVVAKRPENGLLHHSDRSSQYCAHAYQKLLRQFVMQASMSRKENCWDNAPMESGGGVQAIAPKGVRRWQVRLR